jgi:hypothetical protein
MKHRNAELRKRQRNEAHLTPRPWRTYLIVGTVVGGAAVVSLTLVGAVNTEKTAAASTAAAATVAAAVALQRRP